MVLTFRHDTLDDPMQRDTTPNRPVYFPKADQ